MTTTDTTQNGDAEQPVLEVEDLSLRLTIGQQAVPVVDGVSFQVRAGEILGVVGESGSGKSLTALSVMRMLPAAVTVAAGAVKYRGSDLLGMSETDMMRLRGDRLGMVFQDPLAYLNPMMTVGQQIREVLVLHGTPKAQADKKAVELLELVEVRDAAKRVHDYPHQFSGGMRQRVVIAMAVANDPSLLIADEPTTALDVTVQAGILRLLARLRDELSAGLVLISHDIGVVKEVCDSVMVMYAGRIVERGTVGDVLGEPRHPYTRELMRSTPRLDLPVRTRLPAIPGQPPDVTNRPSGCSFHPRCPLVIDKCDSETPELVDRGSEVPHEVACWVADKSLPVLSADDQWSSSERVEGGEVFLDVVDAEISYHRGWWPFGAREARPAVDGVSLRTRAGGALGLVGESGSGKSTLARAIVGLLPLRSGSISVGGRQWRQLDGAQRKALRCEVQMVFQDPYLSLNPRQTVREILTEPLVVHRLVQRTAMTSRVGELMGLVGLSGSLLDRFPYQLSGGQRQRVGIARALAVEPQLIVADEPVSALDVSVQAQIIGLLADLRDQLGIGYVLITHDLSVVKQLCDDVAVMQQGKLVEQGTVEGVFAEPQHPYTASLLAASPGYHEPVPVGEMDEVE